MTIDLGAQAVRAPDGTRHGFEISALRKERLLRGLDDIAVTLEHEGAIADYEERRADRRPWLPTARRE